MQLKEIKVGGIYKTTLKVQFRSDKDIQEVDFFVRVRGKTEKDNVEIVFLNDNTIYYLEPWQLSPVV